MTLSKNPGNRRRGIRLTLAGAVTGALALSPVVFAQSADAAIGKTWNRLAQCESGGRWHINTGNGYYGGLQFGQRTWAAYGGKSYAPRADIAWRIEQILTAEKVLADVGWGAWPGCSRKLGLTNADKKGDPRGKTTPKAPKKAPKTPKKSPKKGPGDGVREYTVKRGDTLVKIAAKQHVAGGWRAVWNRNKPILKDPNRIYVGQRLRGE